MTKIRFGELAVNDTFIFSGISMRKSDNFNAVTLTDLGKRNFMFRSQDLVYDQKKEIDTISARTLKEVIQEYDELNNTLVKGGIIPLSKKMNFKFTLGYGILRLYVNGVPIGSRKLVNPEDPLEMFWKLDAPDFKTPYKFKLLLNRMSNDMIQVGINGNVLLYTNTVNFNENPVKIEFSIAGDILLNMVKQDGF